MAQGDLPGALQAFTEGKNIADKLAAADPGNAQWQRDLSVSWNKLGDVRRAQGDLPGALQAFTEARTSRDKLAAADPATPSGSATSRSAGTSSATCAQAQGDLPGALQAYTEGKNITDKLAAADPGNAEWQRDLSVSWDRLGDVRRAQGDLPGALQAYTEARTSPTKLAAADPGNAEWQRDLIVVSWKSSPTAGSADDGRAVAAGARRWRSANAWRRDSPDSVAMQTTLVVHLAGVARHLERTHRPRQQRPQATSSRALAIARTLADTGRLAPTAAWIRRWSNARAALDRTARHPDPPAAIRHPPDRRILRAHPLPPASPPASAGEHLPALAPLGLPARRGPWSTLPTITPRSRTRG